MFVKPDFQKRISFSIVNKDFIESTNKLCQQTFFIYILSSSLEFVNQHKFKRPISNQVFILPQIKENQNSQKNENDY
jgi:hypothetical protein